MDCCFGLYHEKFHMSGDGETFFSHLAVQRLLDQLTRFSAVGENTAHDQCHFIYPEPDSAFSCPPRSPLHLVPGNDEETPRRWQAIRPLHLPEMCLSAHNQARPKTTQPCALTLFVWFIWFVWFNQTNETNQKNQINQIDQLNKLGYRRE